MPQVFQAPDLDSSMPEHTLASSRRQPEDTTSLKLRGSAPSYVDLMIDSQRRLYGFIFSLLCDAQDADEVLQETNLVLWRKSDEFEEGTNFIAWAFQIARFQVMAHRSRQRRDRHVFDDETLALLSEAAGREADTQDERMGALDTCLQEVSREGRRLIHRRYADGVTVKRLAQESGQTANHLAVRLYRLRAALLKCLQRNAAGGGRP